MHACVHICGSITVARVSEYTHADMQSCVCVHAGKLVGIRMAARLGNSNDEGRAGRICASVVELGEDPRRHAMVSEY